LLEKGTIMQDSGKSSTPGLRKIGHLSVHDGLHQK